MPKLKYKPIAFYPDLIKDWDYEKNTEKPEDLSAGSRNKTFGDAITVDMNGRFQFVNEQVGINVTNKMYIHYFT